MSSQVSVTRLIKAAPEDIFELLATPSRHKDFDGSQTVQGLSSDDPGRVRLGDTFGMTMLWGYTYSTHNEVVEYTENRIIAWRTKAPAPIDRLIAGRTWRYELEPIEGSTMVTETWDISTEGPLSKPVLMLPRAREMTRKHMAATLDRLAEYLETA